MTRAVEAVADMVRRLDPRAWALWSNPRPFVLTVVLVYVAAVASLFPLGLPSTEELGRFTLLGLVSGVAVLVCLRMERARKFIEADRAPNLVATWTFAAALTLGHLGATAVVAIVYLVQWRAERKLHAGRPHRFVFNVANVIVAVRCAQFLPDPLLAGLVLVAVNMGLLAVVLVASGRARDVLHMADARQQGFEVLTLALGWTAATLLEWHVLAILAVVPVVIGVQYAALDLSIRQRSTFDEATGVLTARAWNALAGLRLAHAKAAIVLAISVPGLDHARAGEYATAVRASVRPEDLIGRSLDGFTVLVAGSGETLLAEMLALQMRARLAMSGIDTYVGVAVTPDRGRPVDLQGLAVTASADVIIKSADIHV